MLIQADSSDDADTAPVRGTETKDDDDTDGDVDQTNDDPLSTTPPKDGADTTEDPATGSPDVDPGDTTTDPASGPALQSDTMDIITFDRNGEDVNDILYRDAVLELSRRINTDGSFPISANARELLNCFVEFYLYRVGISAVKEFIKELGLEDYLLTVEPKVKTSK